MPEVGQCMEQLPRGGVRQNQPSPSRKADNPTISPAPSTAMQLRIATRESPLALWQAEHVKARLEETHVGLKVELVPMTTAGDQMLSSPLGEHRWQGPVREGA